VTVVSTVQLNSDDAGSSLDPARGLTRRWFGPVVGHSGTLLERLLAARGVTDHERAGFLKPSLGDIERPWERPDMVAAADVILKAVRAKRRIAIYGDYDVDGITSVSILWHALKALQPDAEVRTYVPHRMAEGYGLNAEALATLAGEGIDLVVTVDCGVTGVDEAAYARSIGLDLVITDHHRPREDGRLPDARAIVHPSLPGREHRFREQCGAFVAWKLAWAIFDRHAGSPEGHKLPLALRDVLTRLTPLAAIGTIADVMPLIGENRAIVKAGIGTVKGSRIEGLDAMLAFGDIAKDGLESETIAFRLAPRLNACGRLGSAEAAVRLLTTARGEECRAIARELDVQNEERRRTERQIYEEAAKLVRAAGMDGDDRRAIVLSNPHWHAGVVGIVCSRLVETFSRPTILFQELEGYCKGSGRSIRGFSLLDAIQRCGETPLKAGGHDYAAGLTVALDRVDAFAEAFIAYASRTLAAEDLVASLTVDAAARIEDLDLRAVQECERLAPFGRGNPRPSVRVDDVVVTAPPREMGKDGRHLLITLRHSGGGPFLKTKWWSGRPHAPHVRAGARLDVVIEPKIDRYLGDTKVEGEIKDVRIRTSG